MVDYYNDDKRIVVEELTLRKQYGVWMVNAWVKKTVTVSYGELHLCERAYTEADSFEEALKFICKAYKDGK